MPIHIRAASVNDVADLDAADSLAARGDDNRRAAIRRWVQDEAIRVAVDGDTVVGYYAMHHMFFGQAFVEMLMVAEQARRRGVGRCLLIDAQQRRSSKLFTSTNLSNQPIRRLLAELRWRSAGVVYGLDEGDPELVFLAPPDKTVSRPSMRPPASTAG